MAVTGYEYADRGAVRSEMQVPLDVRLAAAWKVVQESLLHPLTTSRIIVDPEKKSVRVERTSSGARQG
jgi:hypothetical protein